MTPLTDTDAARALRHAMAEHLTPEDDPWREAFTAVPRHLFVPTYYQQDPHWRWQAITADDPGSLETIYSDRALTTQVTNGAPTSSSSEPSLMLAMLRALDATEGHTVLEIGTGTGYNAALLSHRLGDAHVTTVDVDPELTATAAERLAQAGYKPTVRTGDGALGVPDRAPYDRITATCGLPAVPWHWVEQAATDAVMVVPIGWGLARLTVTARRAEGRFLPGAAYFMPRRHPVPAPRFADLASTPPRPRASAVPVLETLERLQFPLSLALAGYQSCTWANEAGDVTAIGIWTPDGSLASVTTQGAVRQTGPQALWDLVEQVAHTFPDQTPAREEFGLTLTRQRQRAWYGCPSKGPSWELPVIADTVQPPCNRS